MLEPPQDSISQFLSQLDAATSSSSSANETLQAALAQVKAVLPPNTPLTIAQAPRPPPDFDQDPLPSLLAASPSTLKTATDGQRRDGSGSQDPTGWLQNVLHEEYRVAHALEVLKSSRSDAEIQDDLLDVFGFDAIEDMAEAVRRRAEFQQAHAPASHTENGFSATNGLHRDHAASSQLSAHARDYTPGSQLTFASAEEIQAAKAAKKAMRRDKGKGRADGDMDDEPDVEAWLRRREQQLSHGPSDPLTGLRASFSNCSLALAYLADIGRAHTAGFGRSATISERVLGLEERRHFDRRPKAPAATRNHQGDQGG